MLFEILPNTGRRFSASTLVGAVKLLASFYLALFMAVSSGWAEPCQQPDLGASEVIDRLITRNFVTAATLTGYNSTRHYHLEFRGVDSLVADVVVRASYRAPDHKEFSIQSESGSGFLQKRVLQQLLKSEAEASQLKNREQIALTPRNYAFRLLGCEQVDGRGSYVLEAMPRHLNKFLIKGRIYVDDQDFAVIRVRAEPAKSPSWWTVRNEIEQTYIKVGDFWLPARITTNTAVRLLGRAFLTIDYGEYRLMGLADRAQCCRHAAAVTGGHKPREPASGMPAQTARWIAVRLRKGPL